MMKQRKGLLVFKCINVRQVPQEMLKSQATHLVFNISRETWRTLIHDKPCLVINNLLGILCFTIIIHMLLCVTYQESSS